MGLFGGSSNLNEAEKVYYDKDWSDRRERAVKDLKWYTGVAIREQRSQTPDPDTGQAADLYPIAVNVIKPLLQINRSVDLGNIVDFNTSPIQIRFRSQDKNINRQDKVIMDRILKDSHAPTMFSEALLMSQIDGGVVFKVNWEPQSKFLKYRTRIVMYRPHLIKPTYSMIDPWRLESCYLGWEITAEDAKAKYGVDVLGSKKTVIYLEKWDTTDYEITVNGQVPATRDGFEFAGKHGVGRTPIIYIPHIRAGEFFGESHVPDMTGITIEINDRVADIGDAVGEITHPDVTLTDTRKAGGAKLVAMTDNNHRITKWVWDLGDTSGLPGSKTPEMKVVEHQDIPKSVLEHGDNLMRIAHWQGNIPMVATASQNYSSGRMTGQMSLADMFEIVSHSQSERLDFTEGLKETVNISLLTLQYHKSSGHLDDVKGLPEITDDHLDADVIAVWNPQLPLEADKESKLINDDKVAGTTSLESALERKHVPDVPEEIARIEADEKRENDLAIELAKATAQAKSSQFGHGA